MCMVNLIETWVGVGQKFPDTLCAHSCIEPLYQWHVPAPCCRYWSVAVPAYLCVGFVVFLLIYSGLNFLLVPDINDPRNIRGNIQRNNITIVKNILRKKIIYIVVLKCISKMHKQYCNQYHYQYLFCI